MSVRLEPIGESELEGFLEALLPSYAEARAAADHVPLPEAEQFARAQYQTLLPEGFATPGHRFFHVVETGASRPVGSLWLYLDVVNGEAFVYDVTISPGQRRRGHASAALRAAESAARAAGCRRMALNVFAPNLPAQALYRKLGYAPVSHHMNKPLEPAD